MSYYLFVSRFFCNLSPRSPEEEPDDADDFVQLQLGAREGLEQLASVLEILFGTQGSAEEHKSGSNVQEKGSLAGVGDLNSKDFSEETRTGGKTFVR